jgi:RNA polymerase sigma-70 factor, ECF subfamily
MQNPYAGTFERRNILIDQNAPQTLQHVLADCLPSLYRRAFRLLRNAADAEDTVQDALLAACTHIDQFRGGSQMSTWLSAIVHNCARMQLRKRARRVHLPLEKQNAEAHELSVSERLPDQRPGPEEECRQSELSRRLYHCQTQLCPTLRLAFQLRDVQGLSIRETAQILGVSHGAVKARSARARKKLRELFRRGVRPRCPNPTATSTPYSGAAETAMNQD